jgi:hypothetical protein
MNSILKKAGLGLALAATALTAAVPAEAQWRGGYRGGYHGGYHRGGDAAGAALLGGIVGLGVGAAIASNRGGGYYDRGYYNGPRGYYYDGPRYYYNDYYRGPRCWTSYRWDPYYGENVPVRVCN